MKMEEKIYKLGMNVLDELLLHRNTSKAITISLEYRKELRNMRVQVDPHAIFTFDEAEIDDFYRIWLKMAGEGRI